MLSNLEFDDVLAADRQVASPARRKIFRSPEVGGSIQRVTALLEAPTELGPYGEILDRLEDPVLLIDEQRNVLYQNAAASRILIARTGLGVHSGRLIVSAPAGDAQLEHAVAECGRSANVRNEICRGLRLPRRAATRDWLLLISPLRPTHGDSPGRHVFIVHLVSRLHPRQLPATALRDLFGITRKEMDVLSGLLRDESLHDIAKRMSLSHETIRAYVKRLFRKCDVRSRTGLLALLQKVSLFAQRTG